MPPPQINNNANSLSALRGQRTPGAYIEDNYPQGGNNRALSSNFRMEDNLAGFDDLDFRQ
jgi:hypothetical protein